MICKWVQRLTPRLAVGGLTFPFSLLARRHISRCPDCQVVWEKEEKLTALLRQAGELRLRRPELWSEIEKRLVAVPAARARPIWQTVTAGALGTLAVGLIVLILWHRPVDREPVPISTKMDPFFQAMIQHHITLSGDPSVALALVTARQTR